MHLLFLLDTRERSQKNSQWNNWRFQGHFAPLDHNAENVLQDSTPSQTPRNTRTLTHTTMSLQHWMDIFASSTGHTPDGALASSHTHPRSLNGNRTKKMLPTSDITRVKRRIQCD
jgi:hypothetical protein